MLQIRSHNLNFQNLIIFLFFFFTFFPYIRILPLPTDTQPYALLFGMVILLTFQFNIKAPRAIIYMIIPIICAITLVALGGDLFNAMRSVLGYLSFFVIALVSYLLMSKYGLPYDWIKWAVFIWFAVGFIQFFIDPDFATFILPFVRTTEGRGVISLAPEPSYYGTVLIFLLLFVIITKPNKVLIALCTIQILIFCQSSLVVLMLFGLLFLYYFFKDNVYRIGILILSLLFVVLMVQLSVFLGGRLGKILRLIMNNPVTFFTLDASINDRLFNIVFSIVQSFRNFLIPHGFTGWRDTVNALLIEFSPYAWWVSGGRILSTFGAALFELGFVGLIYPFYISATIMVLPKVEYYSRWFLLFFTLFFLLNPVPFALPYLGFFFGLINYLVYEKVIINSTGSTAYNRAGDGIESYSR